MTPVGAVGATFNIYFNTAPFPYTGINVVSNAPGTQNFNYLAIGI
jgi:hypothetical protein